MEDCCQREILDHSHRFIGGIIGPVNFTAASSDQPPRLIVAMRW